jgi:hypothetical protein
MEIRPMKALIAGLATIGLLATLTLPASAAGSGSGSGVSSSGTKTTTTKKKKKRTSQVQEEYVVPTKVGASAAQPQMIIPDGM